MQNSLFQAICRVGIFMICAQAIVHFRPQEAYEKYLKLLISVMVLVQLFLPVGSFLLGGGGQEAAELLRQFGADLEESMKAASENAAATDALLEQMTLEEVMRQLEMQQDLGQGTGGLTGDETGGQSGRGTDTRPGQGTGAVSGQEAGVRPGQGTGAVSGQETGVQPGQGTGAVSGQEAGVRPGQGTGAVSGRETGVQPGQEGMGDNRGMGGIEMDEIDVNIESVDPVVIDVFGQP